MKFTRYYLAAVIFIIVFGIYLYHMCPTVSEGDSGEFITASVNYSIPHAPSYPVFTTTGKVFQTVFPFADYGYRINLVSAVSFAAAVCLLFYMLCIAGAGINGALAGSLFFAFSVHVFENALVTEVFGLHALLASLILFVVMWSRDKTISVQQKSLAAAAFVSGFAFGNHQTIVLMGPALAVWFFFVHADAIKNDRYGTVVYQALICMVSFAAGLSIYAVLPIRSIKDPFLDWSNPENWRNFWRVFTRADYGSFSLTLDEKMSMTPAVGFKQMIRYFHALVDDFTWAGLIAGCVGFFAWIKRTERKESITGLIVLVLFIVSGIGFLLIANMPFTAQAYGVMGRFYIMPALFFAAAIGYSFSLIIGKKYSYLGFLVLLVPVFLIFSNKDLSRRSFFAAYDYGKNNLISIPRHSALFIDGGDDTFYTLAFLTRARRERQDIAIYDRGGLIFPNPYGSDFRRIAKQKKEIRRQEIESDVLRRGKHLLYSTMNQQILNNADLYRRGILFEAGEQGKSAAHKDLWPFYRFRGIYPSTIDTQIYRVRALLPLYDYMRNGYEYEKGNTVKAMQYVERAHHRGYDIKWFIQNAGFDLVNRGYDHYIKGDMRSAEEYYHRAITVNPEAFLAYSHLGVIAEKEGDTALSETYYKKAIEIKPDFVEAYYNLSVVYWKQKKWDKVADVLRNVLELKPDHPQARQYLQRAIQMQNSK